MAEQLRVGATVRVPWGVRGDVKGKVLEIWGDPPVHVRVQLLLDGDGDEPIVLLLAASTLGWNPASGFRARKEDRR